MTTERAGLYRLLAWLSPSFPTGAFSYSHGIEAAAAAGAVYDRASLEGWVAAIVAQGSGRIDADIVRDAYDAAEAGDRAALDAANRRGVAYRATAELALESAQQGQAFLSTCLAAWPDAFIECWAATAAPSPLMGEGRGGGELDASQPRREGAPRHHPHPNPPPSRGRASLCDCAGKAERKGNSFLAAPVCHAAVFGAVAARAGIALQDALIGYLHAFAGNLVSAGLRLGLIGQTDGQRILAALEPVVAAAARAALARDAQDFGAATFALDLGSMAHETQYSRLFRS